ncbi:hypothetical protein [Bacillus sp. FJAT-49736]|nr:hypothetical protein [Bacillus sp. FJAT-49736]MBS4172260.1 hypothetical protein [Bacillus sp. FJAT-49736]
MEWIFKWVTYGMYIPLTLIPIYVAVKGSNEEKSLMQNFLDTVKDKVK